ncbi:hypothetical protein LIS04_41 [Listeria phage LIS04]|nr:hypothetical protein LIS04_41 [Listeria phage LIS04]
MISTKYLVLMIYKASKFIKILKLLLDLESLCVYRLKEEGAILNKRYSLIVFTTEYIDSSSLLDQQHQNYLSTIQFDTSLIKLGVIQYESDKSLISDIIRFNVNGTYEYLHKSIPAKLVSKLLDKEIDNLESCGWTYDNLFIGTTAQVLIENLKSYVLVNDSVKVATNSDNRISHLNWLFDDLDQGFNFN